MSYGRLSWLLACFWVHFLRQIVNLPSTVWQSLVEFRLLISVCAAWQWSGMQNLRNSPPIWSRLWTKVHVLSRQCRRPIVVCNAHCLLMYVMFHSEDISRPCEIVKKVVFGPPILGRKDTPDFEHAFSNYTYLRPCGWIWLSSVQRGRRLKARKKEETLVKHKSADTYVGRPNNWAPECQNVKNTAVTCEI